MCMVSWCFFKKKFNVYLFLTEGERERERASTSGRGAEWEGGTESKAGSRLWDVSTEPDTGLEPTNCEIMTWAKVGCSTDWATQAPQSWSFCNCWGLYCYPVCDLFGECPCTLEKNMYFAALGWKVLNISVKSICSNVSFRAVFSLLIICLDYLSIGVSRILNSLQLRYYYLYICSCLWLIELYISVLQVEGINIYNC